MRTLGIGNLAIGFAAIVAVVPAALAQASGIPGPGKPAGTGSGTRVSAAVPIGRVSVGPEFANGEPIYVRRTTVRAGMTIVEVSTMPFPPVSPSNEKPPVVRSNGKAAALRSNGEPPGAEQLTGRPDDQPAGW